MFLYVDIDIVMNTITWRMLKYLGVTKQMKKHGID